MSKPSPTQIPPKSVVRFVAAIMLILDIIIIIIAIINFNALGSLAAIGLIVGLLLTSVFPITALKTGKPEWILLDLILPS